jgi:hypothetical protein
VSYTLNQGAAEEKLVGQSALSIKAMTFPADDRLRRIRISALILCEANEGGAWTFTNLDNKGRAMWQAVSGKGRCNVDPSSKNIVRG